MNNAVDAHTLIRARFAIVRKDLDEALGRLSDSDLGWAPREGMRTIGGQLMEIAATERQTLAWLTKQVQMPYDEAVLFGDLGKTVAAWRGVLESVRSETLAYIESLTVEELETSVAFPKGWWESLDLPEAPRSEALRSIAAHEWYHTGQLVSYLWMRGDDPYSW